MIPELGHFALILAFFVDLAKKKAAGTLKAPTAEKASPLPGEPDVDQASPSNKAVDR